MQVGILALQGDAAQHARMLGQLGVRSMEVRRPGQLDDVDALVLPGGESTTMSLLLSSAELVKPLAERLEDGMPVLGTCAGMILLAADVVDGRSDQVRFGTMDISVRRNAFGRQIDSFETELEVPAMAGGPFPAVFIRAPLVERTGAEVEVLATVAGRDGSPCPVLCQQGSVVVAAFHPELGGDVRLHQLFLQRAAEGKGG